MPARRGRAVPGGRTVRGSMLAMGLGVVGLALLAACGAGTSPTTGGGGASGATAGGAATAPAVAPTPERRKMSYAALAAHFAPGWVAREAGLFQKYGIDAELVHLPSRQ